MVNPLRQPRPSREESLFHGRFCFADENASLPGGSIGTHLYLTRKILWISDDLAIPLGAIRSTRLIEKGWFPKRRAAEIVYENPVTSTREVVYLCKPDLIGIGLYVRRPLEELLARTEEVRAACPSGPIQVVAPSDDEGVPQAPPAPASVCELCGGSPAYYAGYRIFVGMLVLFYASSLRRRIHCKKHLMIHGLGCYLLTTATDWLGISIVRYPFTTFATARVLAPVFGPVTYVLAVAPTLVMAALILHFWLAR